MELRIIKKFEDIFNKLKYLIYLKIFRDKRLVNLEKFYSDKVSLIDFDLNQDSIVFDVGGYKGEFSEEIFNNFQSQIYLFEPHPVFLKKLETKFHNNRKVSLFNIGLSNKNYEVKILNNGQGTSILKNSKSGVKVSIVSILKFIEDKKIQKIDLLKLNIEGSEYEVLLELIDSKFINNINNLLIQFHIIDKESIKKREWIQTKLNKTHKLNFDYYFVWESWSKR